MTSLAEYERAIHIQRTEALKKGDEIRLKRAQLKRDLKAGRIHITQILNQPPEYIETMKIFSLLMAAPKYGQTKVNNILKMLKISPTRQFGMLSQRERGELMSQMYR